VPLAGEGEGTLDLLAVDRLGGIGLVLLDHREEVAQQGSLVGGQFARDRVRAGGLLPVRRLAHPGMAAALLIAQLDAVGEVPVGRRARYVGCALLRRNRMASWRLATQST